MTKYIFKISVELLQNNTICESIKNKYPHTEFTKLNERENQINYKITINSLDNRKVIIYNLEQIHGLHVSALNSLLVDVPRTYKKISVWLVLGLCAIWSVFLYIAIAIPQNFIDQFTSSQFFLFQISIPLAISIWFFLHDRKVQHDTVNILRSLDLQISEINENLKDLLENNIDSSNHE